jgi:exonuclease III
MKTLIINIISLVILIFLLCSCVVPSEVEKGASTKPEITLQFASLNLGNLKIRIEKKHLSNLARTLKNERVEVLTVQELSRYPGVSTRVDFIDELSGQTEWRNAFGEMANISGKQMGNAVFSSYPIVSYYNQTFDNFQSTQFEAALEVMIDAGVRTIKVVSAQLPSKSTTDEQIQCIKSITKSASNKTDQLFVIAGNLPSSNIVRKENSLNEVMLSKPTNRITPRIWYSTNTSIRVLNSRVVETELGNLIIAEIGLFQ